MGKIIYITENKLSLLKEYEENKEVTMYSFFNKLKTFIKELLNDPIYAKPDELFRIHGISKVSLIKKMLQYNIIEKIQKIEEIDGKARYFIQYKVPKKNFERKINRLYIDLFEKNLTEDIDGIDDISNGGLNTYDKYEEPINEDGATSCAGVGAIGNGIDSSGQYVTPLFTTISRSLWNPHRKNKRRKNKRK